MPNRNTSYYDIDDVIGSIGPGPYPVTAAFDGYGEGGGIEYEVENVHEHTVGANGHVAISKNNDESVMATITVMAGTALCSDLLQLAKVQSAVGTTSAGLPFKMIDPNLGDEITESEAWFQSFPGPTKEDTESEREFEIILPHARKDILLANSII